MKSFSVLLIVCLLPASIVLAQQPIIVDHGCTDLPTVPATWIDQAKADLHIAYGHTSHGSQVTEGMNGLVTFTGGCGGPQFTWNNGGSGGALDLHDYAMSGDCGYYPQWENETRDYLNNPAHSDVNVIIWSWCGQHSGYTEQDMIDKYLAPMTQLEKDYPGVKFVYMTGHVNYWSKTNTDARNQQIRDYCIANKKILYDFAHIESFDPDDTFFEYVHDNCDYYDAGGTKLGNWAEEWQNTHVQGVEWYTCSCAHSKPLNGNQKAYAAWWLWARLAGWEGQGNEPLSADADEIPASTGGVVNFTLDAGAINGSRNYLVLGSASGTTPGSLLPGGLVTLPLNWDAFTDLVMLCLNTPIFSGFMGALDASGLGAAQIATNPLPAAAVGVQLHFAFTLNNPFDYVSNAKAIEIIP